MDKPMVHTSEQAQALVKAVEENDIVFGLTHNHTGYPMVKEARHWVQSGKLDEIQRVVVEYPQDWLLTKEEDEGQVRRPRANRIRAGLSHSLRRRARGQIH